MAKRPAQETIYLKVVVDRVEEDGKMFLDSWGVQKKVGGKWVTQRRDKAYRMDDVTLVPFHREGVHLLAVEHSYTE